MYKYFAYSSDCGIEFFETENKKLSIGATMKFSTTENKLDLMNGQMKLNLFAMVKF